MPTKHNAQGIASEHGQWVPGANQIVIECSHDWQIKATQLCAPVKRETGIHHS